MARRDNKSVHAPTAADLAEIAAGKGSPRDKAEAAMTAAKGSTRKALKSGRGGSTKRRRRARP